MLFLKKQKKLQIINAILLKHSFVWFDRPGESSPEKDCCW